VPKEDVPFLNETVPVGTTLPTGANDADTVTGCPATTVLGVVLTVIVAGCRVGAVELPPNSIAPIDGGSRRVRPVISVVSPGIIRPVPFALLAEVRLKLKLSSVVSDEIFNAGSFTNLASAQISPVFNVGHPPLRKP
jgi:hypothetical protein